MAPETTVPVADETQVAQAPRRGRRGSNLLIGAALVAAVTAGSLWVTGVGASRSVVAAGTSSAAKPSSGASATPSSLGGAVSAAASTLPILATLPSGPANTLISGDGSLDTTVATYSDCSGATELTHSSAAIDTCVSGRTYFVGHNSGVFTPLLDLGVGDIITYYDGTGVAHRLRIVEARDNWLRDNGVPPLANGNVVAQFQTCETAYPDGSHDRILDAVAA
ncbi:MAG TPA: hypothetical protein VH134_09610 [Candidatus Dormibacteraeota bacterium]|nr:hypothetical protein [Candidatus Dormibacteraeota bacterium]